VIAVLNIYALPADTIKANSRAKPRFVAEAIQVTAFILSTEMKLKLKEIAPAVGYGRHSSAARGINTIRTVCEVDKSYRQRVQNIISTLRKQNLLPACLPLFLNS
jgi:chromosomal replication initiation ATPase DnaA